MKKMLAVMMLFVSVSVSAQSVNAEKRNFFENTFKEVMSTIQSIDIPRGKVYGVTRKNSRGDLNLSTPIGDWIIEKETDGGYTFLGFYGKLESKNKRGDYVVNTTLGRFKINPFKMRIERQ